jgi:2-hydroxymuconate-semialdehyde hydrolase
LVEAIPNAELVWIKDSGHWLIDEKPDEIGDRINQFLG